MERADCLPPKIRGYQGKRLTTAGDMAIPVAMAKGPKTKTTAIAVYFCAGVAGMMLARFQF